LQNHSSLKSFPIPLRFILKFSGQSKLGATQLALALTGASRRAFKLALLGECFVKVARSFLQFALSENFGGSGLRAESPWSPELLSRAILFLNCCAARSRLRWCDEPSTYEGFLPGNQALMVWPSRRKSIWHVRVMSSVRVR